jgi:uncharacterized protein (DUF1810 family)
MTQPGSSADPYRLERFVAAQDQGGTYDRAVAELRAGAKVSHWMWFVFPQVAGLGRSATAREFAISAVAEARAYLAHPVLGPRLRECARVVADGGGRSAERIFGPVDAMKLRSSMTLFAAADTPATGTPADSTPAAGTAEARTGGAGQNIFQSVLTRHFGGEPDQATLALLLHTGRPAATSTRPCPGWPGTGRRWPGRRSKRPARNAGEIFEGYSRNSAEFASRPVGHVCLGVNAGNLTIHPPGPGRRAWKSQNCLMIV